MVIHVLQSFLSVIFYSCLSVCLSCAAVVSISSGMVHHVIAELLAVMLLFIDEQAF